MKLSIAVALMMTLLACTPAPAPAPTPVPGNAWTLMWCGGISGWGCGAYGTALYPDKASCYEALATLRSGDQPVAESALKRNTVALCHPSRAGDGE